jgi:hypothetical protein
MLAVCAYDTANTTHTLTQTHHIHSLLGWGHAVFASGVVAPGVLLLLLLLLLLLQLLFLLPLFLQALFLTCVLWSCLAPLVDNHDSLVGQHSALCRRPPRPLAGCQLLVGAARAEHTRTAGR